MSAARRRALPEEETEACATGEGVGGAGADILAVHFGLTAVTLRAQHGAAHQTQSGRARLVSSGSRAPVQVKEDVTHTSP